MPGDFGKGITMPILKDKFGGMFCDDQSHISSLNAFVSDISHACLSAGGASLPYTGRGGARCRIPGWTEFVAPARDRAIM